MINKILKRDGTNEEFHEFKIKDAIKSGSYTIDPEKLAVNMMKFEEELTGL